MKNHRARSIPTKLKQRFAPSFLHTLYLISELLLGLVSEGSPKLGGRLLGLLGPGLMGGGIVMLRF